MDITTLGAAGAYLLVRAFKLSADEFGSIAGDWLRCLRVAGLDKINESVDQILQRRGVTDTRPVKLKFGIPLLEAASLEEDLSIREIYAKLLANAMDPNYDATNIKNAYIDIITGLEPTDVLVLDYCYQLIKAEASKYPVRDPLQIVGIFQKCAVLQETANEKLDIDPMVFTQSVYNLIRVACLEFEQAMRWGGEWENQPIHIGSSNTLPLAFRLTPLGYRFVEACIA